MTALISRQNVDTSKADTPNGVNVANFALGTGNLWDCVQTLGVGISLISSGTANLTQANAGMNLIDASAGAVVINLPACSAAIGALFQFKRVDNTTANSVTINRAGSDNIDTQTAVLLPEQLDFLEIRSDGTSVWRLLTNTAVAGKELLTSGTSTAFTISPAIALNAYKTGRTYWVHFHAACGPAPTIAISGLATPPNLVRQNADGTFSNLGSSDFPIDWRSRVTLVSASQACVETLPPVTSGFVPVRQTVLSGPVDTNGLPNFGGATGGTTVTAAGTLVATAANGFSANGTVDRTGAITNPAWTGLSTNGTMFLYLDIAANGTCTPGVTTLKPTYRRGGADVTTNGQFTFNVREMIGKVGNGSVATQTYRVFVGEVTVVANVVSAIVWYALQGKYTSPLGANLAAFNSVVAYAANLGTDYVEFKPIFGAVNLTSEFGFSVGDVGYMLNSNTSQAELCSLSGRNTVVVNYGGGGNCGVAIVSRTNGSLQSPAAANWAPFVFHQRGW